MTGTPYELLVESASQLTATEALADIEVHNISDAANLMEQNRLAVDLARHLLGPHCRVLVRYDRSFFPDHTDDFSHLRNLARAFKVEALLAASRADFATAASVGLNILELANAVRRGGLIVDLLVGNVISGIGVESLRKIRAHLNDKTRRQLIDALQRLENEREPYVDICARDQEFENVVGSKEGPLDAAFQEVMDSDDCGLSEEEQQLILHLLQEYDSLSEPDKRDRQDNLDLQSLAMTRLLSVDVALRSWAASANGLPRNLADLVPRYLSIVPADPFTDKNFIYRPNADSTFVLYSTGPKKVDGGGMFGPWPSVCAGLADLCLDTGDYLDCWHDCRVSAVQTSLLSRILSNLHSWWRNVRR